MARGGWAMADRTFLSCMHITDLHIGRLLGDGGSALPRWLGRLPFMSGLLGHDRGAARDLERFLLDRREREEAELVIVSGDLTATGDVAQFDLARSFLGSAPPDPVLRATLGIVDWFDTGVSGNHDRWPGFFPPLGGPTPGLAATFPRTFPFVTTRPLADGLKITFIMIDSDADVGPVSYDRVFARGRFEGQMRKLGSLLPPRAEGEVRVMVIHHAIADASVPPSPGAADFPRRGPVSSWRPLEMDGASLLALEHALVDHEVHVVLTGHLHVPRLSELSATNDRSRATVFEARSGTTTQRDAYPARFLARLPSKILLDPLPPNTLVMHSLLRRHGALVWKAEVFWRAAGRGFISSTTLASPMLPGILVREMALRV